MKEKLIMRTKSNIKFYVFCIMLAASSIILASIYLGKGQVSNAASTANVSVQPDVVLSKYDVTGDGKADAIKVKIVDNKDEKYSATMQLFVNDKIAFQQKREASPDWNVKLIKLANGKVFFDIYSTIGSDDACIHQLYICKDDKLKSVYDFQKYNNNYADYFFVDIVKVSGNTLKTNVRAQFYTTGSIQYDMNLNYKNGKFVRTSNKFTPKYKKMSRKNKWTAEKKIKVYKKAGSKKVAYTLKKGNVIKLNKIIYKSNKIYFQVKNSKGKTGYIPAAKKYTSSYFKEAQYAG